MHGLTLTQHIRQAQLTNPEARGELSALLTQIGVAGKVISSKVNMAGLVNILGSTGQLNVQGEVVQKLDEFANSTLVSCVEAGVDLVNLKLAVANSALNPQVLDIEVFHAAGTSPANHTTSCTRV